MTILPQRPKNELQEQRERLVSQNKHFLNTGQFKEYTRNCERIRRITSELNRRENLKHREWVEYL